MDSAIDCTCAELTGSGNDATAASNAIFMMLMVSGGKDAFEKSFIFQNKPFISTSIAREFFKDAAALGPVQSYSQAKKMWRQSGRSRSHCVTQPVANLCADSTAMDPIDLNAVWLLVGHEGCRLQ